MADPFLGEIRMVGFNFAPVGWALCNGQTLSISQYSALFALLGTSFGGNGTTTFNLPDMQGRVPINAGSGAGLSPYILGQSGGTENVTLSTPQMPSHTHLANISNLAGTVSNPTNATLAQSNTGTAREPNLNVPNFVTTAPTGALAPTTIGPSGGNLPHPNLQPYLTVYFIIALNGIFPSRN